MPQRKALLVALDQYPNPANNLPSCVNDANGFEQAIRSTYGFTDVRRLVNDQATLANVESGLDWLFGNAAADDRLVFYFSGHGFQVQRGDNLDEVLCLYDEFLFDDTLSNKTQSLPPGTFTLVSDSCHSGGMYKVFEVEGETVELALTKVLKVPPPATNKVGTFLSPEKLNRLNYRPFGSRRNSASAIAKRFGTAPTKSFDEAGQLAMNGLLLSACLENETASASTSKTDGKSAFTFALLQQLQSLGSSVNNVALMDGTTAQLKAMNFRQTPVLMEPARPPGLGTRPFLLFGGQASGGTTVPSGTTTPTITDPIMAAIMAAIASMQGKTMNLSSDYTPSKAFDQPMTAIPAEGGDKFWGAIASLVVSTLPTVVEALRKSGYSTSKDFNAVPGGQDKFWGVLIGVAGSVIPSVIQALRKGGYEPQKDFGGDQQKFWGALARTLASTIPTLIREVTKSGIEPQKDFGGEEKFWRSIASVVSSALPAVIQALSKQGAAPKGFENSPQEQEKFWGAIASVVSTALPAVIQALRKGGYEPQKDFGGEQEKFWGALVNVVSATLPVVINALAKGGYEPQKDFGGEEKFWGAFSGVISRCLPAILSAVSKGDMDLSKSPAGLMGSDTGEDKFWGAVARVVASALPTIVGELTKSGVGVATMTTTSMPNGADEALAGMPRGMIEQIISATGGTAAIH